MALGKSVKGDLRELKARIQTLEADVKRANKRSPKQILWGWAFWGFFWGLIVSFFKWWGASPDVIYTLGVFATLGTMLLANCAFFLAAAARETSLKEVVLLHELVALRDEKTIDI